MYNEIEELNEEIRRLGVANEEKHEMIVSLHTDLQEVTRERDMYAKTIQIVDELVIMTSQMDGLSIGTFLTVMSSISNVLRCGRKSLAVDQASDDIPDVIKEQIADMEDSLNADLPDGVSVVIKSSPVSPKQMSEILDIFNSGKVESED